MRSTHKICAMYPDYTQQCYWMASLTGAIVLHAIPYKEKTHGEDTIMAVDTEELNFPPMHYAAQM